MREPISRLWESLELLCLRMPGVEALQGLFDGDFGIGGLED